MKHHSILGAAVCCAALFSLAGCEDKKAEPTGTNKPATASPQGTGTGAAKPGAPNKPAMKPAKPAAKGVTWKKPEKWKDGPEKMMRMATFMIPPSEGDSDEGEVSVSRAMGSVEANVTRWRGQFKDSPEAKVEDKEVAGIKTTLVEIEGTWMPDKEGWKMVVAMMHTKGQAHFFKMWGPKKTIDDARSDFDGLLGSISQK